MYHKILSEIHQAFQNKSIEELKKLLSNDGDLHVLEYILKDKQFENEEITNKLKEMRVIGENFIVDIENEMKDGLFKFNRVAAYVS